MSEIALQAREAEDDKRRWSLTRGYWTESYAATTSRVPQSTAQSRPFGGGSGGGRGVQTRHQTAARDTGARAPVPSFAGQQQGPACWTCGGDHLRRDCPQEAGGQSSQARPQSAQVVCDHCGRAGHTRDRCFDLHPELTSGGRGRGGDAPRGRGGRGGRGAGAVGRPVASAASATESAMAARIEQLEQRLAAMAGETIGEKLSSTTPLSDESTWQAAAARMESLPARPAIDRERVVLVYEEVEEMVSLAAAVSSSLDVPLWDSCHALQQEADRLVKKAWSEASLPAEAERVSGGRLVCGLSTLSPLVTTPIVWEYSPEGVCLLDLFGGISTGLAAVLQSGILVRRYLYVEKDETARRVSSRHVTQLMQRFPLLLPRSAVRGYQKALPADISLLGAPDLDRVGHIDLVIAGWPCQGHTRAGHGAGLHDPRSRMFWEMLRVLRHLQEQQTRSPAYILENVPLLGDTRAQLMASVHEVRA
ncbi:hypothetical protein AXG93_868s1290 [Marchantia polymorpha subsp. ruderalis]|uniref:CCHC-type domain-containing protein n=1 Tax=Marchantia polymorpha subsp. ruderalis TaxID=1480154 RepID=A0A176VLV0_MARPO|nr:hypothetical protein AXG93_868s1290 [Marchantia polymorpha subsp. ruderalis]